MYKFVVDCKRFDLNMIYVNIALLTGLSTRGIACQTGLSQLRVLTCLKQDLIRSGVIKILCMIFVHTYREPEVGSEI